jgi:hypothetical protein
MSLDTARALLIQAQQQLASALLALDEASAPPPALLIATPAALDLALARAPAGAVLTLSRTLVYPGGLTLTTPVTLQSEIVGTGRMTREEPAPTVLGGIRVTADDVTLIGLAIRHTNPRTDIVVLSGARPTLDRCRVLGDPLTGAKRGIAANGSAMTIRRGYIDDCWQPAQDAQAICAWDMGPGLDIDDCYLAGGAQSVMLGGADPTSEARTPRNVSIQHSTLTKNPRWFAAGVQLKCALELKNAIGVRVTDCALEYAGTSQGQGAYLIVATPRNQGGQAPYSTVRDVVIAQCTGRFAAGLVNLLGTDNVHPSGPLADFTIQDCQFTDIDPTGLTGGTGRLFMVDRAPQRVTLDGITVAGQHLAALGYFSGAAPVGFVATRLTLPPAKYGWKIDAGGMGRAALQTYMPDAQLDGSVV